MIVPSAAALAYQALSDVRARHEIALAESCGRTLSWPAYSGLFPSLWLHDQLNSNKARNQQTDRQQALITEASGPANPKRRWV